MYSMDRHIFNLKFASKQMARNSNKSEKCHSTEKEKCKKAIRQGNMEIAKIHAENAIRHKNQAVTFLNMSVRLDSVASRVQYASTMQHATRSLEKVSKAMELALKSMNLEELCKVLDKFEQECLDLDVQTMTMDTSMMQASSFAPQDQIDRFMHQIADEAGLDINLEMPSARASIPVQDSSEKEDLEKRFGALRNKN